MLISPAKKWWHTKSFVNDHPELNLTLVNRYPRSESIVNPTIEQWNSKDFLMELREAWAEIINLAYEAHGMEERVDHRSYEEQGLDLIPTIHEGKAVTIAEKRLKEEYEQKIVRGEDAVLQHTDIRNMNIAIREHNQELRIIAEIKKLRTQLERIIEPVKERLEAISQSVAESLERLRVDIVSLSMRINKAIDIKSKDDERIRLNQMYIKDLAPIRKKRLEELQLERKTMKKQFDAMTGLFNEKKREELQERMDLLDDEIDIQKENRKLATNAQKEIKQLKTISEKAGEQIRGMQEQRTEKINEYSDMESRIPEAQIELIRQKRLVIRPDIENEIITKQEKLKFQLCAQPRVCSLAGGSPVYPRSNQPDISESWDGISNGA